VALWSKDQIGVAYGLYCQLPYGKIHSQNPVIIEVAGEIGRTPSALAMKMLNLASLDPLIVESGRSGLGNASALDREVWDDFHSDWNGNAEKAQRTINPKIAVGRGELDFSSRDVLSSTKVRIGQGFFRQSVLANYQYKCCMSGLSDPRLLVASHIVPWAKDENNRLNPGNGLCLSALHDRAFDIGLLTITVELKIKVSASLRELASDSFGQEQLVSLDGKSLLRMPEKFHPQADFIDYHNRVVFKG